MRITTKGQVTIPVEIREELGFLPHTEVVFEIDGQAARLRKAESRDSGVQESRGQRIVRRLRGKATAGMSTEEILSLTRGDA